MHILIIANSLHTGTLTGGDKIFVECAKRWLKAGNEVTVITTQWGRTYCLAHGFPASRLTVWPIAWADRLGYPAAIFLKTFLATWLSLTAPVKQYPHIIFASSFFFPDMLPALVTSLRFPGSRLCTAFYLFVKRPFGTDYSGGMLKGFFFWLNQTVALAIVRRRGSAALTASDVDAFYLGRITGMPASHVLPVKGGVDNRFFRQVPAQPHRFDAVFVGRYQPQKGLMELLDIWKEVSAKRPESRLALIGTGPQERELRNKARRIGIGRNVAFLGIRDGKDKARLLKSSRVFVSASRYDSGNIALDEALACGTPGIVYDMPALPYDSGVIRIPRDDPHRFADSVIAVLDKRQLHDQLSRGALRYASGIDWDVKSARILAHFSRL